MRLILNFLLLHQTDLTGVKPEHVPASHRALVRGVRVNGLCAGFLVGWVSVCQSSELFNVVMALSLIHI